jgi:glutathione S-transferase
VRPRLVTIPISHYGERARWALDHAGIDYDEEHHLQMFSWVAAYGNGGGKTLPILLTGDATLSDSEDILRWASERATAPLFPREANARRDAERLSRDLAGEFGVESRRVVYDWAFRVMDLLLRYNVGRAPPLEEVALRHGASFAVAFMRRYLAVTPATVARGIEVVDRVLDSIAERLADGRRYLVGDTFTAADLTFASLTAPCIVPDRYGVPLPAVDELPEDARTRVGRWRAHPAGAFALRLYDERPRPRGTYLRPLRVPSRVPSFPL